MTRSSGTRPPKPALDIERLIREVVAEKKARPDSFPSTAIAMSLLVIQRSKVPLTQFDVFKVVQEAMRDYRTVRFGAVSSAIRNLEVEGVIIRASREGARGEGVLVGPHRGQYVANPNAPKR